LQITRQTDYALRTMLYLARAGENQRPATHKIAEEMLIPSSFLAKIVSQLANAGMIATTRGARGGITLAKPTNLISVYDVVEAIDGPIQLNECTHDPCVCPFGETCPVHEIWCEAEALLVAKLMKTTLAELLEREKKHQK